MKKQIVALMLLVILLLPMLGGIRRIRKLPREQPPEDEDPPKPNG